MNWSLTTACVALGVVGIVASVLASSLASNAAKDFNTKVLNRPYDEGAQVLKKWGVSEIIVLRQGKGQTMPAGTSAMYLLVDAEGIVRDVADQQAGTEVEHAGVVKVYLQSVT